MFDRGACGAEFAEYAGELLRGCRGRIRGLNDRGDSHRLADLPGECRDIYGAGHVGIGSLWQNG
jgi:hypothetical protein